METLRAYGRLEVFSSDKKAGTFAGFTAIYGRVPFAFGPKGGVFLEPGAFNKSINDMESAGRRFKMLWNHDSDEPIGLAEVFHEQRGVRFNGELNLYRDEITKQILNAKAGSTYSNIISKVIDQMSVGFDPVKREFDEELERITIREARLIELSPVTFPASPDALIDEVFNAAIMQHKKIDFRSESQINEIRFFIKEIIADHFKESLAKPDNSTSLEADEGKDEPQIIQFSTEAMSALNRLDSKIQNMRI
jgi:HK97 family phage prohead protease